MVKFFRLYFPLAHVMLLILEGLVFLSSVTIGSSLRGVFIHDGLIFDSHNIIWKSLFFMLVMVLSMVVMGMYRRNLHFHNMLDVLIRIVIGFAFGWVVFSLIFYLFPNLFIRRGVLASAMFFSFAGILLTRSLYIILSNYRLLKKRVLVIGAGKNASQLQGLGIKKAKYGFDILGYVHIFGEHDVIPKEQILAPETSLVDLCQELDVDEIVVAVDDRRKSFPVDEILECKMEGIDVTDLVMFFERQTGKIKLDALHPSSLIFTDGFNKILANNVTKRTFDIVASLIILLFSLPVMLLAVISILLESKGKGNVFYIQDRVGKNGKVFKLIKFRTMDEDAEADGLPRWSNKDDDRMTSNGMVLRYLRIDETPQLINVLMGDMSLIGPRPERPEFVNQLSQIIPFYKMRHRVKPGLSGWAQISYPYGSSEEDAIEKLQYDLYYMKNYSMMFDIFVLLQTAAAIFFGTSHSSKNSNQDKL